LTVDVRYELMPTLTARLSYVKVTDDASYWRLTRRSLTYPGTHRQEQRRHLLKITLSVLQEGTYGNSVIDLYFTLHYIH